MKFHYNDLKVELLVFWFGFELWFGFLVLFGRWRCAFIATEALDPVAKCSFVPGSKSLKLLLALKAYGVEQGGKGLLGEHKEPKSFLFLVFLCLLSPRRVCRLKTSHINMVDCVPLVRQPAFPLSTYITYLWTRPVLFLSTCVK